MAATFVVEDGTGKTDSNALVSEADSVQYHENHSDPTGWSGADTPTKENAIREATQYLELYYNWKGNKSNSGQALQWPRGGMEDRDGYGLASDVIPQDVKDACSYLALQVVSGDTLIPVQQDESAVKKFTNKIGPLTQSKEYIGGERPTKDYPIADKLVAPYITGQAHGIMELTRA
jgi:hypothetical protein